MSKNKSVNNYPEYILLKLRKRWCLDESDNSLDGTFQAMTPDHVFSEVLSWEGLLVGWDRQIKRWVQDIYGVDLNENGGNDT